MRGLLALLFAVVALNLAAVGAAASCLPSHLPEQAERAELVVFGVYEDGKLEVRKVLKGSAGGTIVVRLGPSDHVTSIDHYAENGSQQTLYLRSQDGIWVTDQCSGSHAGPPTREELDHFEAGDDEYWTQTGGAGTIDGSGGAPLASLAAGSALVLAVVALALAARRRGMQPGAKLT